MASEIGEVKVILGKVEVIGPDGSQPLRVGDKVFSEQIISTGANSAVEIEFLDGTTLDLPRDSQIVLDTDAYDPSTAAVVESDTQDDIAALQQALLDGNDPTQEGEATAANAQNEQNGNEGSSTIQIAHELATVTPESGFESSFSPEPFSLSDNEVVPFPILENTQNEPTPPTDDQPIIVVGESQDEASEFTVVNHDEVSSAGYHNSYGYYVKTLDADGNVTSDNPTTGVIIEDDVHFKHGGFTDAQTVTGYSMEQIGYFIIPDGGNRFSTFGDNVEVSFKFVNGQWQAFDGDNAITGRGSHVLFDNADLNVDGQDHVTDNWLTGNQNWEDLQIPNGDGDYNDVNLNVDWTKVTVSGDTIESISYGSDGPGAIDFTLSEDVILTGSLTSNGKTIAFSARDTDNDQHNDQIVGSTDEGEVLTIDGLLDGDYSLNVLGPIDDGNGDASVALQANVSVSDDDGSVVNQSLSINLNIDANQILGSLEPPTTDI